jgi:Na+/melibiose symporter-like transporter
MADGGWRLFQTDFKGGANDHTQDARSMLTPAIKFSYWFGQLAEGLKNSVFSIFLLFYFNQVMGVSGTLCGLALMIATSIDAVTDPLMGSISDHWQSTRGRRHPFMFASALPLALSVYFLFNPMVTGETALFFWLLVFTVLTRLSMTLYHVPHLALGAELTQDFDERTSIAAFRMVFGASGWLLVAGLGFGYFFAASDAYPNGQLNPAAYPPFAAVIALGIFVSIVVTSYGTRSLIPHLPKAAPGPLRGVRDVFIETREAFSNQSFRYLVASFILISVPVGMSIALSLYLNTFYWQLSPGQVPLVLLAQFLSTLIGYALAPILGRFLDKKRTLIAGVLVWALATATPYLLSFAGIFPDLGSQGVLLLLITFAVIAGMGIAQLVVAINSMMADIADEHELTTGKRNEGIFFGAFAFMNKAATGIGSGFGGAVLDLIDWPTGEHIKTAADVSSDTLLSLAMIGGPTVALAFIPFYGFIRHYNLDRQRLGQIQMEIKALRSKPAPVG